MTISIIVLAAAAATHSVPVNHHGTAMQASYSARTDIVSRTTGARTPNRMDMQRCHWTATVHIDRKLDHSPALARTVASNEAFKGSEAGACPRGDALERQVIARNERQIQAQLMAAVKQDRAPLLAELDAVRNLAAN